MDKGQLTMGQMSPMWNSCSKPFGFCKDRVLRETCLAPSLPLLSRPNLIGQDLRTRNLVVFKGNGFMAFELSFKTPRLHISTPLEIVTSCWQVTQREPALFLRGLWTSQIIAHDYCKETSMDNFTCVPLWSHYKVPYAKSCPLEWMKLLFVLWVESYFSAACAQECVCVCLLDERETVVLLKLI